jgi:protein-L-isoaspartate(D-aspartate) O-methyltransferase
MEVAEARRRYAAEIEANGAIKSKRIIAALARVPREKFLGKGPWHFPCRETWMAGGARYRLSQSDDPCLVYQNSAIALDPARDLVNGPPGRIGAWIEALNVRRGDRLLHIGCGTGYYTAVMAELVGNRGRVLAVEIDKEFAHRAREYLQNYPQVEVRHGEGATIDPGPVDAILLSYGVLEPAQLWLDRLEPNGAMILPLTFAIPGISLSKGAVYRIQKEATAFRVKYHSFVLAYGAIGARDKALNERLHEQYRDEAGGWMHVKSLRRDVHLPEAGCWFHASKCCFSTLLTERPGCCR